MLIKPWRILTFLPPLLAPLLFAAPAQGQSSIELRPAATVTAGAAVTLDHVARLEGPDATALAGTIIIEARLRSESQSEVTLDDVRRSLKDIRVNWGRIALRGSSCALVPAAAEAAVSRTGPTSHAPPVPAPIVAGTIRAAVAARIAQILGVYPEDVDITFGTDDAAILDLSDQGRTLEIRPVGSSERMPLAIAVYEKSRVVAAKTIRVGVKVRRPAVVVNTNKRRGEMIDPNEVATELRWFGASDAPASFDQVVGAGVRSRLDAGQVVMASDVEPLVAVNKGEIVSIRCLSGSLILSTRGRALATARDGEMVQFQAVDSKRTFYARMDGRGRAIIIAGDSPFAGQDRGTPSSYPVLGARLAPPMLSALEVIR